MSSTEVSCGDNDLWFRVAYPSGMSRKKRYQMGGPRKPTQFKNWRKYRNLTQQKLADRIGTTKTRVSMKENGNEPWDDYYLEALSEALGASGTDLLARNPFEGDDLATLLGRMSPEARKQALQVVRALTISPVEPPPTEPKPAAAKTRRSKSR